MVAIAVRMIIVLANVFVVSKSSIESCQCQIHNATLALVNNNLQFIEDQHYPYRISRLKTASNQNTKHTMILVRNVSRCVGTCYGNSKTVCRPSVTFLKTVTVAVPWKNHFGFNPHHQNGDPLQLSLAVEEHKSCLCVDANSINITLNLESRLRRKLHNEEEAKLNREIRSVAPTSSNDIISTRATYGGPNNRAGTRNNGSPPPIVTDREIGPDGITPTEHEIVYYKTCLACREQQELCKVNGQIYDAEVCHCVYAASRTFLNSFYTLGVVMLTVMVCCFLVFGVQKGDENVLNSSRRSTRRASSSTRRCSVHNRASSSQRHYRATSVVSIAQRDECSTTVGINGRTERNRAASINSNTEAGTANIVVANSSCTPTVATTSATTATITAISTHPAADNSVVTNAEITSQN